MCLAGLQLVWQLRAVNLNDREDCMRKFVSNKWFGILVWAGIALQKYLEAVAGSWMHPM